MKMVSVWAKNSDGYAVLKDMRWGLIPWYFKDPVRDWTASTFHARLESVATTKSFERSWRLKRRVLFPMSFFSEKNKAAALNPALPARVSITRSDGKALAVAGIYDLAQTVEGPILSVAMLTRAPGRRMFAIHDREPVVIDPEDSQAWLDGSDDLDLAKPLADDAFEVDGGRATARPRLKVVTTDMFAEAPIYPAARSA